MRIIFVLSLCLCSALISNSFASAQTTRSLSVDTVSLASQSLSNFVSALDRIYHTEYNTGKVSESMKRNDVCAELGTAFGFAFSVQYIELQTKELNCEGGPTHLHSRVLDMIDNVADLRNGYCGSNNLNEKDLQNKIEAAKKAAFEAAKILNSL